MYNPMHDPLLEGFFQQVQEASKPHSLEECVEYEEDNHDLDQWMDQQEQSFLDSFDNDFDPSF